MNRWLKNVTPTRQALEKLWCLRPFAVLVVNRGCWVFKRRNVTNFQQRIADRIDDYFNWKISFAELDASVAGWINHVRYADTWGLRDHVLTTLPPIKRGPHP